MFGSIRMWKEIQLPSDPLSMTQKIWSFFPASDHRISLHGRIDMFLFSYATSIWASSTRMDSYVYVRANRISIGPTIFSCFFVIHILIGLGLSSACMHAWEEAGSCQALSENKCPCQDFLKKSMASLLF